MPPPGNERTVPPPDIPFPVNQLGPEVDPTLAPFPRLATPYGAPTVPGYTIKGELGRGGMGVVYHAIQDGLNRPVALKMVLSSDTEDPRERARFLSEAEAVATIRHPHVVQVHEFGEAAGRPYFAMEFLAGGPLADRLRSDGPLPPARATALVRKLALGVQVAHDLEIVHRDLKPANVLFDAAGEPKIADFGLAKRGEADITRTGTVMGTPGYMSPEQARGQTKFVGPQADVYALGVILYESLTGRVPFAADDAVVLLMMVAEDQPMPVRRLAKHVSKDLERVVHKCLAKDPRDRYTSASDLAEDLECTAAGEPPRHANTGRIGQVIGALGKGRHASELTLYANLFIGLAILLLLTHAVNGFVGLGSLPSWAGSAAFFTRVIGIPAILVLARRMDPKPVSSSEWVLWSVWGGYLIACGIAGGIQKYQELSGKVEPTIYPVYALLAGVAFFTLAPTYWGWLYIIGIIFFLLPFVMMALPLAAPFYFGGIWAVALLSTSLRLRRLVLLSMSPTKPASQSGG